MPVYHYIARSETGVDSAGVLSALNEEALYKTLRREGLFLLRARERHGGVRPERLRLSPRQLLAFTIHISTFLEAGIPLVQALNSLSRESAGYRLQILIEGLVARISAGSLFSDALSQYPRIFDKHYVQMVAVGEATGQLGARMGELVKHLEWQQEIRSQIKQSSTYPLIIAGLLLLVIILMMTFTLPKFVKLLQEFHGNLPAPTRVVIALSNAFTNHWYLLALLPASVSAVYWIIKRTEKGELRLDQWKLKLPIFGSVHGKIELSRFAHHFAALHAAGIDTPAALSIVEGLVGNRAIAEAIRWIRQEVITGKSLAQLLARCGRFPTFVVQMFEAGEESGNMEATLKKVSEYYDREIPIAIKRAFSLIEPLILVAMGGLVVFVALSILLPVYEFGTSINR